MLSWAWKSWKRLISRRLMCDRRVIASLIVVPLEGPAGTGSLGRARVGPRVGPLPESGLDEAFRLPVGLRTAGPGPEMPDPEVIEHVPEGSREFVSSWLRWHTSWHTNGWAAAQLRAVLRTLRWPPHRPVRSPDTSSSSRVLNPEFDDAGDAYYAAFPHGRAHAGCGTDAPHGRPARGRGAATGVPDQDKTLTAGEG